MRIEIVVDEVSASRKEVGVKGWSNGQPRLYSSVALPGDTELPKVGSVMVLEVSFRDNQD